MKFIKLTRVFDSRPVWLNAGFVVTVEPRREGTGSVVVPVGDGLDYDVRESPEDVLRMLEGAPAPEVVPVSVSDCLAPAPKDVSPEPESEDEPAGSKKPRRKAAKAKERTDAPKAEASKSAVRKATKKTVALELSDEQVARLARLSPKSEDKLKNTLLTQFHVADAVATVLGLEAKGVIRRDGKRITWAG